MTTGATRHGASRKGERVKTLSSAAMLAAMTLPFALTVTLTVAAPVHAQTGSGGAQKQLYGVAPAPRTAPPRTSPPPRKAHHPRPAPPRTQTAPTRTYSFRNNPPSR
jgi:hypothetical protein